jgi:triphosphoribosyl-dephospho-CoA synthetase
LANSKVLKPYEAVWQRSALQRNTDNIGAYFHEVPNAQQLGLGEAPATSITTTTNRDPLGFLTNLVSTIGNAGSSVLTTMQKQQDQKTQTAMATVQAYTNQMMANVADNKMPLIIGGVAVAGLIGWYLLRR